MYVDKSSDNVVDDLDSLAHSEDLQEEYEKIEVPALPFLALRALQSQGLALDVDDPAKAAAAMRTDHGAAREVGGLHAAAGGGGLHELVRARLVDHVQDDNLALENEVRAGGRRRSSPRRTPWERRCCGGTRTPSRRRR